MLEQVNLTTDRLLLRPFVLADAPRVRDLADDKRIAATTLAIPSPYPLAAAHSWIAQHADWWAQGKAYTFAITLQETDEVIGAIDLIVSQHHSRAEMGYWLGVEYWGQGIMSEAAQAVVQFGLHGVGLNKITASHMLSNPASGKVMIKAGMKKEGLLRSQVFKSGKFHDSVVYGILASDG